MPRQNRAKLFAPYDALKGFEETVHAKDTVYVQRAELSEYVQETLDRKLRALRRGQRISVTWFRRVAAESGEYRTVTGIFQGIDSIFRTLALDAQVIRLSDIVGIDAAKNDDWPAL